MTSQRSVTLGDQGRFPWCSSIIIVPSCCCTFCVYFGSDSEMKCLKWFTPKLCLLESCGEAHTGYPSASYFRRVFISLYLSYRCDRCKVSRTYTVTIAAFVGNTGWDEPEWPFKFQYMWLLWARSEWACVFMRWVSAQDACSEYWWKVKKSHEGSQFAIYITALRGAKLPPSQ